MSIMWSYLDKEKATIEVLGDYESMKFIMETSAERIGEIREKMMGLDSPKLDGMPKAHNPQAGEEKIAESLDKIDTIKERYRQAVEFMNWFEPAWNALSEDEQYVLEVFFVDKVRGAVAMISEHFGIEHNSVYKKRKRALEHLQLLLYGKE